MQYFISTLYKWYRINQRELPWRTSENPYLIWISEIILQQTRVQQGMAYYKRFTEAFPTVQTLASASEDEVLKMWQGLGYYSRARNLHKTAKIIVNDYNGVFPADYKALLKLKGVGPYTAAAIASIAFSLPHPAIDGNVYRVLSRYFGLDAPTDSSAGKKQFQGLAEELIDPQDPAMHNQAMMEFGALQCVPKSPDCANCPLLAQCYAAQHRKVEALPVKSKAKQQRERYFYYYLLEHGDTFFLEKRTSNDIWKNLYQLPLLETQQRISDEELLTTDIPFIDDKNYTFRSVSRETKHVLSHQIIRAKLVRVEISADTPIREPMFKVNKKDISKFAVPRLLELFFEDLKMN